MSLGRLALTCANFQHGKSNASYVNTGEVPLRDAVGRSWELDAHQRLQQPSSSRCSDRTAISLCRVLCRGSPRTLDHRWPLVHERHYACTHEHARTAAPLRLAGPTRVRSHGTGRSADVVRAMKTLATDSVLSDANERARSLASTMNT